MLALSLVAAACGDDEETASTEAPATTAAASDTTAAATETTAAATETTEATEATDAPGTTAAAEECAEPTEVKLQLQWVTQAQFAGYYAAIDQGFYEAQCLDVTILEGAVDITPQDVLANGEPTSRSPGCRRRSPAASRARTS
jgi:NitT/TauT family transport system substrate-binding protein